jgi:tripartite-type tricarboxylate transporter receptor subunit TctC
MKTLIKLATLCFAVLAAPAFAQSFPSKPVRIVVPFPPGGPADMLARLISEKLPQLWGQPLVIENRSGAAGNIGAEAVARAPADGYFLLLNASSHIINGSLYAKLPYDPIADFTPITQVASYNHMFVVHPSVPANTVKELVALAKAKPQYLSVGNSGSGTPGHLAAELFRTTTGVNLIHVPYKGSAPATTDLLAGQVLAMFNNPVNTLPYTKAGRLRAIAVTGEKRLAVAPDVPTVAESGYPGFEAGTWFGIWGPANTPAAAVASIHENVVKALRMPDVQQKLAAQAWDTIANTPAQFSAVVKADHEKWSKVIRAAGLKAD